jgi:hypothetical protein
MTPWKGRSLPNRFDGTRRVYRGRIVLRGLPLILILFRVWRKLPAAQKRQALSVLGRYGPIVLAAAARQARAARRRRG